MTPQSSVKENALPGFCTTPSSIRVFNENILLQNVFCQNDLGNAKGIG